MSKFNKTCKTCGKADLKARVCQLFGIHIKDTDYCSFAPEEEEMDTCGCCGKPILMSCVIDVTEESPVTLCPNCYNHKNSCHTCKSSVYCDFNQNPIAIPPMVQQRIQQGPMTTITTVKNPERIAATCKVNCACWDKEYEYCKREEQNCSDYKPLWSNFIIT